MCDIVLRRKYLDCCVGIVSLSNVYPHSEDRVTPHLHTNASKLPVSGLFSTHMVVTHRLGGTVGDSEDEGEDHVAIPLRPGD